MLVVASTRLVSFNRKVGVCVCTRTHLGACMCVWLYVLYHATNVPQNCYPRIQQLS